MTNEEFKKTLWETADKLRGSVSAAEYKYPVLGLVFLKYVSDMFDAQGRVIGKRLAEPRSEYYIEDQEARAAAAEQRAHWLQGLVGSRQQVLVERPGDRGHAENFAEVRLAAPRQTGETVNVTIARVEDGKLAA